MNMPDNYDYFCMHEAEMDEKLDRRPVCVCCEEHIQDDHAYNIGGELYCPDCMESQFRMEID